MDTSSHTLNQLFQQLGLPASDLAITEFVESHQLSAETPLEAAPFWSTSQSQLFIEARAEDADWVVMVDELDALLHKAANGH